MNPVEVIRGISPVILAQPHTGVWLPEVVAARLNERGRALTDTDWHIGRLYRFVLPGATTVRAKFHRYLIDANRDPSGESLYPGQNTTGLVPFTDFDGHDIWDTPPTGDEIEARRDAFHARYHAALADEVERVRAAHGVAIVYDCHSIRSHIPFLFEGKLPDFNIGSDGGKTCDPTVETAVAEICESARGYTTVRNGRFRGGWTTRHYGRPQDGVHAIQMELAQSTYLASETPPWRYDQAHAARLRAHLSRILQTLADLAPNLKGKA